MTPVYTTVPGWKTSTTHARNAADLPPEALAYIAFLESVLGTKISVAGVGPGRDALVHLRNGALTGMLVPA
jgi:adenylosuccinate synthase